MPHLVELRPSTTSPAIAGIGIPALSNPDYTLSLTNNNTASDSESESESDSALSIESDLVLATADKKTKRKHRQDLFSQLPANVLQQILAYLPPFQMLTISELSRKFYNFVVLGQEMNEVWFRLVKHEEAEEKKRVAWFKQKLLEQEHRSVQMMRSYSGSSTCSTMSNASYGYGDESATLSKQAQRLLNKKHEAAGKSTSTSKAMKRSDRKKNWCKIYVDSILRGNGDSPLEPLSQVGPGKRTEFQTIILNESLAAEHHKEFRVKDDVEKVNKPLSREAKTQLKMDQRMYYKSIRSKPKGKKAGQMDSAASKVDKIAPWRQSEWSEMDHYESNECY